MPLNAETKVWIAKLDELAGNLVETPVGPGDPLYLAFHEAKGNPRGQDPVEDLRQTIASNARYGQSVQVFSGFRGTGKSSELLRLKSNLEEDGHEVVLIRAGDYVNMFSPPQATDVLVSVAAGVAQEVARLTGEDRCLVESFWNKLGNLLRTEVAAEGIELTAGGIATVRMKLSREPTFKERIQEVLKGRLAELFREMTMFMTEARQKLLLDGVALAPVLIVDDLEKIQGVGEDQERVRQAVEHLFTSTAWALAMKGWHVVWTCPPYLQLLNAAFPSYFAMCAILPMVRVRRRSAPTLAEADGPRLAAAGRSEADKTVPAPREVDAAGLTSLIECMRKRGDLEPLFESTDLLEQLILASCGHLRDLVSMMSLAVTRARGKSMRLGLAARLGKEDVDIIVSDHYLRFRNAVATSDYVWLRRVSLTGLLPAEDLSYVSRAAKLLDTAVVMTYRNGDRWCDVHEALRPDLWPAKELQ